VKKSQGIGLVLEILIIVMVAISLWYKILLPDFYYAAVTLLITVFIIQIIAIRGSSDRFLIIQTAMIFLLIRSIYYFSTNYSIIPFGDANWDYAVTKTFIQKDSVFVIGEPRHLTMYSSWPLLHTLILVLSSISGLDAFHLALLLPSIFGLISFGFVYLLVEKIRKSLKLNMHTTLLALLMYAVYPDLIFWQMQSVRQNIGILLFTIMLYLLALSISNSANRKYKGLTFFFAFSLVIGHNLTSLVTVVYLFLLFIFVMIGEFFEKRRNKTLFPVSFQTSLVTIAMAMSAFLFVWWDNVAKVIWPLVSSSIERFSMLIRGIKEVEYTPRRAFYPDVLTPPGLSQLLLLRDILILLPAIFGLFFVIRKATKTPEKSFLLYSCLALGAVVIIDNFIFRIGIYRIVGLSMPFIGLLSAISYSYFRNRLKRVWQVAISGMVVIVLLSSSFIGLWGHDFAPFHLYDPSINPAEVGERDKDFMVIADFNKKVPIRNYHIAWVDDRNSLLFLFEPDDYSKISWLPTDIQKLGSSNNELAYAFDDLNLYFYYASAFSPVHTLEDAKILRIGLRQRLQDRFNFVYNDGNHNIWITP